jgi:hypothetical protein
MLYDVDGGREHRRMARARRLCMVFDERRFLFRRRGERTTKTINLVPSLRLFPCFYFPVTRRLGVYSFISWDLLSVVFHDLFVYDDEPR